MASLLPKQFDVSETGEFDHLSYNKPREWVIEEAKGWDDLDDNPVTEH